MPPKNERSKSKESNVNVFVRCRPLNQVEKRLNAFPVVTLKNRQVLVKHEHNSKTFQFDHVFGPSSTQMDVFKVVVQPALEEALLGYNCTIFAYGQTGTGKTFTMEGEKSNSGNYSWDRDPMSGIIPRALHQLFERLDGQEFSLRLSFIELYNEELFDLLGSDDLSHNQKLRIYEDPSKKSAVVISGVEEVQVHSKHEVFQILERGASRRRTAETLMNAHSSRSHSVFTITIHSKDVSSDGEEFVKIGKLNLVDLAGSENIARSGAVEKRAREAGNINQSLLTLGRVITALVDKKPHIPYRESKLTRILQDSLGGKTKTTIIATVSPASSNVEETMSTLDYAFRAKNITNKPEINQRFAKKALIREYTEEIERLKRDLIAQRDKNGMFISKESYDYMQQRINQQDANIGETEEKLKDREDELKKLTVSHEELQSNFDKQQQELQLTKSSLEKTEEELQFTTESLNQHIFIIQEQKKTEESLTLEAQKLIETVTEISEDNAQLHSKIERMNSVSTHNEDVKNAFVKKYDVDSNTVKASTADLIVNNQNFANEISAIINEHAQSHYSKFNDLANQVRGLSGSLIETVDSLFAALTSEVSIVLSLNNNDLESSIASYKDNVQLKLKSLKSFLSNKLQEVVSSLKSIVSDIESFHSNATKLYEECSVLVNNSFTALKNRKLEFDKAGKMLRDYTLFANQFSQSLEEDISNAETHRQTISSNVTSKLTEVPLYSEKISTISSLLKEISDSSQKQFMDQQTESELSLCNISEKVSKISASLTTHQSMLGAASQKIKSDSVPPLKNIAFQQSSTCNMLVSQLENTVSKIQETTNGTINGKLSQILNSLDTINEEVFSLCDNQLRRDIPSGDTPLRKNYAYVSRLPTTDSREALIQRYLSQRQEALVNESALSKDSIPEEMESTDLPQARISDSIPDAEFYNVDKENMQSVPLGVPCPRKRARLGNFNA